MTATQNRRKPSRGWWKLVAVAVLLSVGLALVAAWMAYARIGKTPGELMDYAERRLQGHTRLESVALPVLAQVRASLDEPSVAERRLQPFIIPRPPQEGSAALAADATTAMAGGRVLRVGPAEAVVTIAAAARVARDGDVVEIQAGTYRGDVTVWNQKRLTIRGVGGRARLFADGRSAEDKAIWVFRNGDFDVANIDFIGAKASDKNGAGIRFEGGRLRVSHCLFWGNENGILTTNTAQTLDVQHSEFGYNGQGDGYSHHLYAGRLRSLTVTGSYFHHANIGHLLKSRAASNVISYNRFTDEDGGRASYELDFPNGGTAYVMGNLIQQSRGTENSTMVAYGEEGLLYDRNTLVLSSNTLVNDRAYGGTFVLAQSGTEKVVLANNLLIGSGVMRIPFDYQASNNPSANWGIFALAPRQDYRLNEKGRELAYQPVPIDLNLSVESVPTREYVHPMQVRPLTGPPAFAGALQSSN